MASIEWFMALPKLWFWYTVIYVFFWTGVQSLPCVFCWLFLSRSVRLFFGPL